MNEISEVKNSIVEFILDHAGDDALSFDEAEFKEKCSMWGGSLVVYDVEGGTWNEGYVVTAWFTPNREVASVVIHDYMSSCVMSIGNHPECGDSWAAVNTVASIV